jgi:hypothetical protein
MRVERRHLLAQRPFARRRIERAQALQIVDHVVSAVLGFLVIVRHRAAGGP